MWPAGCSKATKVAFAADGRHFLMYGKPVQILSGSVHYFRILPELWKNRLTTMKAAGLNTVQTYVEWSSHEPEEGQFDFERQQELVRFLYIAHSLNLMVILRPGPYIGADRDFGGLPYWLLRNGSFIGLRSSDKKFLSYAKRYLSKVFEKVKPLLISKGGPVIMVQLENEYESYGVCDLEYMHSLRDLAWAELGRDVVLFTTDAGEFKCDRVDGVIATVNFGTDVNPKAEFARNRRHQKRGPLFNTALSTGWPDHWGKPHRTVNATLLAARIRTILQMKASFNLYMFHGGTNFGFKAGADEEQGFRPQITSYHHDAPISEAGDATETFKVVRDVINEMFGLKELRELSSSRAVKSPYPLTFEQVGHAYGFMLYETRIAFQPPTRAVLQAYGIRDRGYVYQNNSLSGILSRSSSVLEIILSDVKPQQTLSILVENQGRISSGDSLLDPKGLLSNVTLDGRILSGWEMRPIDLSDAASWLRDPTAIEQLRVKADDHNGGLAVYATSFALVRGLPLYDNFLLLEKWTKGVAFLNGFNLGRYWTHQGPQRSLYVPLSLFRGDGNLLVLLELEGVRSSPPGWCSVEFVDSPYVNAAPHDATPHRSTYYPSFHEAFRITQPPSGSRSDDGVAPQAHSKVQSTASPR
ncbi:beta-galactosidase-like [Haemaphysalis longicornis]